MSLIGTMYKEPRVFAHDAIPLSELDGGAWILGDEIIPQPILVPPTSDPISYYNEKLSYTFTSTAQPGIVKSTPGPGVGLYIGVAGDITVIMESGKEVVFLGVAAGTFLPISILSVVALSGPTTAQVLAIY
jgi:hypothetical protein